MKDAKVFLELEDHQTLKTLDEMPQIVLIMINNELIRGIDYRAPKCVIELLVATEFEHIRMAKQGLGRICRQGRKHGRCCRKAWTAWSTEAKSCLFMRYLYELGLIILDGARLKVECWL